MFKKIEIKKNWKNSIPPPLLWVKREKFWNFLKISSWYLYLQDFKAKILRTLVFPLKYKTIYENHVWNYYVFLSSSCRVEGEDLKTLELIFPAFPFVIFQIKNFRNILFFNLRYKKQYSTPFFLGRESWNIQKLSFLILKHNSLKQISYE